MNERSFEELCGQDARAPKRDELGFFRLQTTDSIVQITLIPLTSFVALRACGSQKSALARRAAGFLPAVFSRFWRAGDVSPLSFSNLIVLPIFLHGVDTPRSPIPRRAAGLLPAVFCTDSLQTTLRRDVVSASRGRPRRAILEGLPAANETFSEPKIQFRRRLA